MSEGVEFRLKGTWMHCCDWYRTLLFVPAQNALMIVRNEIFILSDTKRKSVKVDHLLERKSTH